MSTKIQINSLKALETLLNGDPEFSVEFRKSVLLEYEKKHILPSVQNRLEEMIQETMDSVLCVDNFGGSLHIRPETKRKMKSLAKDCIEDTLQEFLHEAAEEVCCKLELEKQLEAMVKKEMEKEIREKIIKELSKKK